MFPEWMEGAPTPFSSVLVANRGEIAVRVIMAVKEAGLRAIAVYSDSDSNALHVEMADDAVHLTGNSLTENYLNSEAIILAKENHQAPKPFIQDTDSSLREQTSLVMSPTQELFG